MKTLLIWIGVPLVFVLGLLSYVYVRVETLLAGATLTPFWQHGIAFGICLLLFLSLAAIWTSYGMISIFVFHFLVLLLLTDGLYFLLGALFPIHNETLAALVNLGVIPLLLTSALILYGHFNVSQVKEKVYRVTTGKEISKEGYKVALLADVHYGLLPDHKEIIGRLVQRISGQNVDAVLLCGDIVDERTNAAKVHELFEMLGKMKTKFGIYYVYGNHDTSQYVRTPLISKEELARAMTENGIRILKDEAVRLEEGFTLAGREDRSFPRKPLGEVLEGVDPHDFLLLLDHQPYKLSERAKAGVDLTVSGHTHAGQFWPLGIINYLVPDGMNYGIRKIGNMIAIVTSGVTGYYILRTASHSEYVTIYITREE